MDHGMGETNNSNGILMEDEIFETSPAASQPQPPSPPEMQPQPDMSPGYNAAPSQEASQFTSSAQPQPMQQSDGLAEFQSAPSFEAMDMGVGGNGSQGAFGENRDSGWQNQDSGMAFQGSSAGRAIGADQVVMYEKTPSNMILGVVGALVGALIGAALWIGIYQLGYIAGIAGAAIIGLSIKGYIILGKSVDVKGLVFCALLSIVTVYLAHRAAFAISYMRTMNETFGSHMSFMTAFTNLDSFMKTMDAASRALGAGSSVMAAYWRDLVVGYVLSAVVGIPMARKMVANI